MKREWENYIKHNKSGYADCCLVSAINAYYYLTGKIIKQDSARYERLIDLSKCRYGPALSIDKVYKKLGLKISWEGNFLYDFIWRKGKIISKKKIPLPLEVTVYHRRYGLHSILIVDHCTKSDSLRITNFDRETTASGWMFREDMYKFERKNYGKIYKLITIDKRRAK